jgi:hypothetical protein
MFFLLLLLFFSLFFKGLGRLFLCISSGVSGFAHWVSSLKPRPPCSESSWLIPSGTTGELQSVNFSSFFLPEVVSKPQIRFKSKAQADRESAVPPLAG